jgi:hypothetical protein
MGVIINGKGFVGFRSNVVVGPVSPSSPSIVTSGLTLYLDAGNSSSYPGTGTTWTDLSSNGNNGTLVNGPTYSSDNSGSIVFDGTNDYASLGNTPNITGLINITLSVWVNPQTPSSYKSIFTRYSNITPNNGFLLSHDTDNKFYFDGRESNVGYLRVGTTNTYALNNWYNVTCTKSGNLWSIYINGVLQNSAVLGLGNVAFGSNNAFISSYNSSLYFGKNKISNLQIYNRALSASEVLQNFNTLKTRFYPQVADADAQAFIYAAQIQDSTQASAINTLVTSLKSYGVWTKMKAIYPFVGGTAASHKWNLKDPRDLDAAYRLTFTAGWVHSSTGAKPNGTSDYGNTFFNPLSVGVNKNNFGLSVYSRTNNTGYKVDIGANKVGSYSWMVIRYNSTNDFVGIYDDSFFYGNYVTNSLGLFTVVRESSTVQTFYQNGVQKAQRTGFSTTGDINLNIYLSARNFDGSAEKFSDRQLSFASIHDSLSTTEAANFYTAVQTYQTTLGRQV